VILQIKNINNATILHRCPDFEKAISFQKETGQLLQIKISSRLVPAILIDDQA